MVDKKQAADSYGLLKMEINEWISTWGKERKL